jgi:hypothetical protein
MVSLIRKVYYEKYFLYTYFKVIIHLKNVREVR